VEGLRFQVVEYGIVLSEGAIHEHCKQVILQIVHTVQNYERYPDCVECSEIVIADTSHRYQAELRQWLIEQAIRDPYAHIGYCYNTHQQTQPSQKHDISKILKPVPIDQNITLTDHLLEDTLDQLVQLPYTGTLIDLVLASRSGIRYDKFPNGCPYDVLPYDKCNDDHGYVQADVDEELRLWDLYYFALVD